MIPSILRLRRVALSAAMLAATTATALEHAIPPGGTVTFGDAHQAGLCDLPPRRILNARHGTIFDGGTPAPVVGDAAVTTRAAIAAGAVTYRHDGGLEGDVVNVVDDCFGITRIIITVLPPVCGDGAVGPGEECDPGAAEGGACCTAECRLVAPTGTAGVLCRLDALIAWIGTSDIRPAIRRTLVAALERVRFRVATAGDQPGPRRTAFLRSARRRLRSFAARVRSYAGRQAITPDARAFLLGASEPVDAAVAALLATP